MRRLTGQNTCAFFLAPLALERWMGPTFEVGVNVGFGKLTLAKPRLKIDRLADDRELELLVDFEALFVSFWRTKKRFRVTAVFEVRLTPVDASLQIAFCYQRIATIIGEGWKKDPNPDDPFEKAVTFVLGERADLSRKVDLPLSLLAPLVGDQSADWHFRCQLLAGGKGQPTALVLLARLDAEPELLEGACPLEKDREAGLAIHGRALCARINEEIERRLAHTTLPLGWQISGLAFELAGHVALVTGRLMRPLFGLSFGATEVRVRGSVKIQYDREEKNFALDTRALDFDLRPGLAGLALILVPVLSSVLLEALRGALRRLGPRLVADQANDRFDGLELALAKAFKAFDEKSKLRMTLHDATIEEGALWLVGDIELPPPTERLLKIAPVAETDTTPTLPLLGAR